MARIRTIKPEFPQSESVGRLSRDARLLFIQLWTIVDDAGRARAASRMLASLLYPYDDDARDKMDAWLVELERAHMIRRYEVDGSQYLEISKWLEHQKIDRPSESRLPAYRESSMNPREPSRGFDADLVPSTKDLGPVSSAREDALRKSEPKRDRKKASHPLPDDYPIQPQISEFSQKRGFTSAETIREHEKFRNHAKQNDRRCVDWIAAERNWLISAAERLGKSQNVDAIDQKLADDGLIEVLDEEALSAWDAYRQRREGKTFPRNRAGGWRFPSKYPPGYQAPDRPIEAPKVGVQGFQ